MKEIDNNAYVERLKMLADERGISVNKMMVESGAGREYIYNIAKGQSYSVNKTLKLANYLGVSIDYLLGNTDKKERPISTSDIERIYKALEGDPKIKELAELIADLSPDQVQKAHNYLRFLKSEYNQSSKKQD